MRNEQRYKLGATKIEELQRAAAPTVETHYRDRECPAFYVRHMPTGALTYCVRVGRSAKSLGPVSAWIDNERAADDPKRRHGSAVAREHAQALLTAHRKGEPVIVKRRSTATAPTVDGLTLLDVLGTRAATNDGVEVVGRYPRPKRTQVACAFDSFVHFVGKTKSFKTIDSSDVKRWTTALSAQKMTRSGALMERDSVKRYMSDVRGAFAWAVEEKLIERNPFVGFKLPKRANEKRADKSKDTRWLTADEERALRAALASRDVMMRASSVRTPKMRRDGCRYIDHVTVLVLLALATGGRRGALFNLRWKHIERLTATSTRVVFEGKYQKAGQTYHVPLHSEAVAMLNDWRPTGAGPNDLVFPGLRGRVLRNIDKAWSSVRKAAGLVGFRFHDLRHTFASKLVQRGYDLLEVSKLMGHADIRMTQRYANLDPRKFASTVESLLTPIDLDEQAIPPHVAALVDRLVAARINKSGVESLLANFGPQL
jgi:integrase